MERKTVGQLLRNPAWLWLFGIGCGGLVLFFLSPEDMRWARGVFLAIAAGTLLYSLAHVLNWHA